MKWIKANPDSESENKVEKSDIGNDFKEHDGESIKVKDEPSGKQSNPKEKTDNSIGEDYKEEGNQEIGDAPEGKQKTPSEGTDTSIGKDYKEEGKTISAARKEAWQVLEAVKEIHGYAKNIDGIIVYAKTEEEASKIDSCVEEKMKDPNFKPQSGRSKKQSAYAVCTASVLGTAKKAELATVAELSEHTKQILADLTKSFIERAEKESSFKDRIKEPTEAAKKVFDVMERVASRKDLDFIRLAHYQIDCPTCFKAIMKNIESGLVPSDFLRRPKKV
jgi:hypothetical protein